MELDLLVAATGPLAEQHAGWVTLLPDVPADYEPSQPLGPIASMVASSRYEVPVATWVAGAVGRRGLKPDSLGIQHSTGAGAVRRLAEEGAPVPHGWRLVQDHPRRGLIVEPPLGTSLADMLQWLVRAGALLSKVPFTGRWHAEVHQRR